MKIKNYLYIIIIMILISACEKTEMVEESNTGIHPGWSYNVGIYEINIRQYTPEGTFEAFEKHLPRLKEMGVGILWLMPIHPIGEQNRKGSLGSYYSVKDYKAVNPEFGTLEEFRELVEKIHGMGMYVIIDWVANHAAWDNVWVEDHPEFFTQDSLGNYGPPEDTDWSDVIDFNFENMELWDYMIDALKYWVKECNIDGFRCDVAAMVPLEFWHRARKELNEIKPVFMLAEAHEPELHEYAFDMTYNWQLKDIMNGIAAGENDVRDLIQHFEIEKSEYPDHAYRMTFITNHDENSWNGTAYERLGNGVNAFAALTGVVPGMMLVYSGQEAGLNKPLRFFDKDTIEWKNHELNNIYSKLFHLKSSNKALWNGKRGGELTVIESNNRKDVLCLLRTKDENKILALFNFSPSKRNVKVSNELIRGNYTDLFTGKGVDLNSDESFEINPWGFKILFH